MVRNPRSNAGDKSLIPGGVTKILCATGQLSPLATTREPAHSSEGFLKLQLKPNAAKCKKKKKIFFMSTPRGAPCGFSILTYNQGAKGPHSALLFLKSCFTYWPSISFGKVGWLREYF